MKVIIYLLFLSTIFRTYESSCEDDWPSCGVIKNIVCERKGHCGHSSTCILLKPDETIRRWLLDEHNTYRNMLAVGNITTRGWPAANMMALSYDLELEYAAVCSVTKCQYVHDKCRRTKEYTAGQNIAICFPNKAQFVVRDWFFQYSFSANEKIIKAYSDGIHSVYTQLVWAETTRIGCAWSIGNELYYLTCNYGNAGNIVGSPVYIVGTQCSKCPTGVSCNAQYRGLCGEIDESDLTKAPIGYYKATQASKASNPVCFHQIMLMVSYIIINII